LITYQPGHKISLHGVHVVIEEPTPIVIMSGEFGTEKVCFVSSAGTKSSRLRI